MSKLLQLTIAFYDSAWDFSTRIIMLPDQLTMPPDPEINPDAIIKKYKDEVFPFLDLQGSDIPLAHRCMFDQVDTTVKEEVFPAFEVLTEAWDELRENPSSITAEARLVFAEKCVYLANLIEMYVIAQTSEMRDELQLQFT